FNAAKINLIEALDSIVAEMDDPSRQRFLTVLTEEILRRREDLAEQMVTYFRRLGWSFVEGQFLAIILIDASELDEVPETAHVDLLKSAARFRDGDLSGSLSAACGAVDSVTQEIYAARGLRDPGSASFQEKVSRCLDERGVLASTESELIALGWSTADAERLRHNLRGALNHAANVMQSLRSNMGDVHGSKPALVPLVFDCIKWSTLIIAFLKDR
ncbi:MAG: hypothetical protein ACREDR_27070, partial [Blastocatellia bacterium]